MSKLSHLLRRLFQRPKLKPGKALKTKVRSTQKEEPVRLASPEDPFLKMVAEFDERCTRWPVEHGSGPVRFGFLLTPWLSTAAPLFLLECARYVSTQKARLVFFVDDTNLAQNAEDPAHMASIKRLVSRHFSDAAVIQVGELAGTNHPADDATAAKMVRENAIWRARGEQAAEDVAAGAFAEAHRVASHLAKVRQALSESGVDRLLIPGGIFGLSYLYVSAASQMGLAFATFDGSNGVLRLCQNGIAAHLADMPAAFRQVVEETASDDAEKAAHLALTELDDRINARDFRRFQVVAAGHSETPAYDIVVPMNIRWDSAALDRQKSFGTVEEWLSSLLDWVKQHEKVTICIRQHPRERLDFARGRDDLSPLLSRHADLGGRLRFVRAEEEVSTYDLLQHARVVLPHTSTVGIEAAMLGKPVLLSTTCYYESMGFCQTSNSPEDYFAKLGAALQGAYVPSPEDKKRAAVAYYLTQRCAYVRTSFTAVPDDFKTWHRLSPEKLWSQPECSDFGSALLSGRPLSLLRHERLIPAATTDIVHTATE